MTEHPILFSTEMVKAILDGRKTMTRRVMKPQPQADVTKMIQLSPEMGYGIRYNPVPVGDGVTNHGNIVKCPYGQPGDLLWVRETWQRCPECGGANYLAHVNKGPHCQHCDASLGKWKPSIHMFRDTSRITLEVTGVRVERVRDISEDDAKAEGVTPSGVGQGFRHCGTGFQTLWDTINAKRGYSWDSNPWVWVVEFRKP